MTSEIVFPNKQFNFSQLSLSSPVSVQGGTYFTKIKYYNNPLYIQLSKCLTRQGLNETNKKAYIDLMYSNESDEIIEWFENLENKLIDLIYEKKNVWFQNEMERTDIENYFNSSIRPYRGGKYYLIRINILKSKKNPNQFSCNFYDENENEINIKDLQENQDIIPILEVQGIKFSARSFQVDLIGKQMMLLNSQPLFNSCKIVKQNSNTVINNTSYLENHKSLGETLNNDVSSETASNILYGTIKDKNINEEQNKDIKETHETHETQETHETNETNETHETHETNETNETVNKDDINLISTDIEYTISEDSINNDDGLNKTQTLTTEKKVDNNSFDLEDISDSLKFDESKQITLKQPNEVYYEIYKLAKEKAKKYKKASINHYLEAKKIKNTYLLEDLDESDDSLSDDDNYDNDSVNELYS